MKNLFVLYKKYVITAFAVLLIALSAVWIYCRYAAPTRIHLVNYPEYILAPLLDQELNPALDVRHLKWGENSGEELRTSDCVIFFGMGLHFTELQQKLLNFRQAQTAQVEAADAELQAALAK